MRISQIQVQCVGCRASSLVACLFLILRFPDDSKWLFVLEPVDCRFHQFMCHPCVERLILQQTCEHTASVRLFEIVVDIDLYFPEIQRRNNSSEFVLLHDVRV